MLKFYPSAACLDLDQACYITFLMCVVDVEFHPNPNLIFSATKF